MFRPQLRRRERPSYPTQPQEQNASHWDPQFLTNPLVSREQTLIPEAFLQETRLTGNKAPPTNLIGMLNTCEHPYPKPIEQQITPQNNGFVAVHEQIFSFFKQRSKVLYLWQYETHNFNKLRKILKHQFVDIVTAVVYGTVNFVEFDDRDVRLVVVGFGRVVRFYRLRNFEIDKNNDIPYLQDLMITLYSPQIVTTLKILHHQHPTTPDATNNSLSLILGDDHGNLLLFDLTTKKKYIVDTLKQKLTRTLRRQNYSEIQQIVQYKEYIFCLLSREYESNAVLGWMQRIFGGSKDQSEGQGRVQQRLQVYKIETNVPIYKTLYRNVSNAVKKNANSPFLLASTSTSQAPEVRVTNFRRYCQYTTPQLVNKIRSSYNEYCETGNQNEESKVKFGLVDSIGVKGNYVEVMFKSGVSVLVDQDVSFAAVPTACLRRPDYMALIGKNIQAEDSQSPKLTMLRSLGTSLMLFQGFLASQQGPNLYITPHTLKDTTSTIRSLQPYTTTSTCSQYLVLSHKGFTLIQPLTPSLSLFIYCAAMAQEFPYKKFLPQDRKFQEKINKIVEFYGEGVVLSMLMDLLMDGDFGDGFRLNLRMDLFQLAVREISNEVQQANGLALPYQDMHISYKENMHKNGQLSLTKQIEQLIWRKIILKIDKTKIEFLQKNNKIITIESICLAIQAKIGQIFKGIKNWNARTFCIRRNEVYGIIARANILREFIDKYVAKQSEYNAKKRPKLLLTNQYSIPPPLQSLSFATKFSLFSKTTLQKLTLLLSVYDHLCQMDFHGTQIPKFSDLLFTMSQEHRLRFASTVINTLGLNNQVLIDGLCEKIPELRLDQVRRYNLWKAMHQGVGYGGMTGQSGGLGGNWKGEEHNRTFDTETGENQVEELSQIMNQVNYKEIENYYLNQGLNHTTNPPTFSTNTSSHISFFTPQFQQTLPSTLFSQKQKQSTSLWLKNLTIILKSCLAKILSLRKQQIQLTNTKQLYKKSQDGYNSNYMWVLEVPILEKKIDILINEIGFFTRACEGLLDEVFRRHRSGAVSKDMIGGLLEAARGNLTIEVRRKIQNDLKDMKLMELTNAVSRRNQLFSSNEKPRPQIQALGSNFLTQQLSSDVINKYY